MRQTDLAGWREQASCILLTGQKLVCQENLGLNARLTVRQIKPYGPNPCGSLDLAVSLCEVNGPRGVCLPFGTTPIKPTMAA